MAEFGYIFTMQWPVVLVALEQFVLGLVTTETNPIAGKGGWVG